MDPARTTSRTTTLKLPKTTMKTAVIGDSQTKHFFHHFDPLQDGTPAFICKPGAGIDDVPELLKFVPPTTTNLVIHIGANDLVNNTGRVTFGRYKHLLSVVTSERVNIQRIYATLILPRSLNRRRGGRNLGLVRHCNREACDFNSRLRRFCRHARQVFFLDHALEWFPSNRVFAADGLHPSFEGVAVMASHIKCLAFRHPSYSSPSSWSDRATSQSPQRDLSSRLLPGSCQHTSQPSASAPSLQTPSTGASLPPQPQREPRNATKRSDIDSSCSHHYGLRSANRSTTVTTSRD